ncbi:MAG: hypothetical protein CEE42_10260 [Promethearchaeota archaeon Loki_b31]|nr:MAG: hypothetical protein CEE42_10260 [Candidatus Lokiarchaeota archaeon Loki_b31]
MDLTEEKRIVNEILKDRALSYSIELLDVEGDKYTMRNTFGSTIIYKKKGNKYFLEDELD